MLHISTCCCWPFCKKKRKKKKEKKMKLLNASVTDTVPSRTVPQVTGTLSFNGFGFGFISGWHRSPRKDPYALRPVSQQSPQGCPRNSANICLVELRSFSTLEGGMSAASFPHSSFLQAIDAVMLWTAHVRKVPQASEHLCPAKLQTIIMCYCCACQSICPFIPTDSGVPRTVDPQKSSWPKTVHGCLPVGVAQ